MRGQVFHNYIAKKASLVITNIGWKARLEYPIASNGTTNFVDILASHSDYNAAFEIETTLRHISDNCIKAYEAGIPLCIIVPTKKLQVLASRQIKSLNLDHSNPHIIIFRLSLLHEEVTSYLSKIIQANNKTDKQINKSRRSK